MLSGHVLRECEIQQQAGIARHRPAQLFVYGDRVREPASRHQFLSALGFQSKLIGLCGKGDAEEKKKRQGKALPHPWAYHSRIVTVIRSGSASRPTRW